MDVSKSFFLLVILVLFQGLLLAQNVPNDEDWSNLPLSIDPGNSATPPCDAIILLGRNNLEEWVNKDGELPGWKEKNGVMEIVPGTGDIFTKKVFGDEWPKIKNAWRAIASFERTLIHKDTPMDKYLAGDNTNHLFSVGAECLYPVLG